jgi:adenylate cyclase
LPKLRIAIAEDPSHPQAYRFLAACYAHLGRIEEARAVMARLRTVTADPLSVGFTLRNERHRQLLLAGMRLASGDQR